MNYKYLITITFILSSSCLSACSYLQKEKQVEAKSDITTEAFSDIIVDSEIRQQQGNNIEKTQQKKMSCYEGWGYGDYKKSEKGGLIKALQIVKDCDNKHYALALDSDGEVSVWNLRNGLKRKMFILPEKFNKAVFSPDGKYIGISHGAELQLFPIMAGVEGPFKLDRLNSNIVSLSFDPNSRAIMMGATDSTIYRWEFNPEEPLRGARVVAQGLDRYHQHSSVVSALAFHPYGRLFFSADWDGYLNAWLVYGSDAYKAEYDENLFGTRFFAIVPKSKSAGRSGAERIEQIRVSANGQFIALGTQDGGLEIWQVRGLEQLVSKDAHTGMIYGMAISPTGSKVVTVARDGALRVWEQVKKNERLEAYDLKLVKELDYPLVRIMSFIDENTIVVGDLEGKVFSISLN